MFIEEDHYWNIWPKMKTIHWRIKKIKKLNQKVNHMPDDAADANNARHPRHHHLKPDFFFEKPI